ncbi:hypothetical protein Lalb_Chr15g0078091 [Lupinus albus]|uniref:Uncharacterized protein n=1 Tax=Lupinus albus TaxID=3870 RepID=A0A6A4PD79_LUPAL|nr:hypothetical protein Lalb_Chr15g0078091 [Lupinus albus]
MVNHRPICPGCYIGSLERNRMRWKGREGESLSHCLGGMFSSIFHSMLFYSIYINIAQEIGSTHLDLRL